MVTIFASPDLKMKKKPQKIAVFCPNWVGDVVMATPVFQCLRNNFPDAIIIGVFRKYVHGVVEDAPWFDRVLACQDKTLNGFLQLVVSLRRLRPDMAVVLPNSIRSALAARLGGINKVYGFKRSGRSILLSGGPEPVRNGKGFLPVPMADYYMEICRWLGLKLPGDIKPSLYISDFLHKKADRLLDRYGINPDDDVIGINPGAKFGSSKCWPPEYFAKLADLISECCDCRILLLAGPGEEKIAESIIEKSRADIINTAPDNVDLAVLKCLVKRCRLLITNDTGPRHYAVAFGIPVVVIMGPTDYRYTDSNLEKTLVLREELDCSPCHKSICPRDHRCMLMISPESVLNGSKILLEKFK